MDERGSLSSHSRNVAYWPWRLGERTGQRKSAKTEIEIAVPGVLATGVSAVALRDGETAHTYTCVQDVKVFVGVGGSMFPSLVPLRDHKR